MIDLSIVEPDRAASGEAPASGNEDWQLHSDGLEHRGTGYFIARDALGARRDDALWLWPLQIAEKSWCAPRTFRAAFLAALDRFGIARDEALSRSFAVGFGMRTGSSGGAKEGFVAIGELVRPRPVERKRPVAIEPRSVAHGRITDRVKVPVGARA